MRGSLLNGRDKSRPYISSTNCAVLFRRKRRQRATMTDTPELRSGIYPPLPTFFTANDELDLRTLREHIRRIAESGIAGYVVMGTNGEAVHLSNEERVRVIETTRATSGEQALILAGCGEQSTRASIVLCRQAARAGASFALILPPFYFKGRM